MQLNLLTRLATASGILILGQQWIPNLLKYKINREGKYCLWHVRNFLILILMIKQRKAKKTKQKTKNKQTNKQKTTNTKNKHGTCIKFTSCTCYPKNPTEYAPLSHLIKLTENKNRNTIIFRLFLLKFLPFFFFKIHT